MKISLAEAIVEMNAEEALSIVKERINQKDSPGKILEDSREGLEEVGKKFEQGEFYVAELMMTADTFEKIMDILEPELKKNVTENSSGKVVIATVKDDVHYIGKNLVASVLKASGFNVIDLGENVDPETISDNIEQHQPHVLALSCLLTTAIDSVEDTIDALETNGLRTEVKILVGGVPFSDDLATEVGADAYGEDAYEAVVKCRELVGEK